MAGTNPENSGIPDDRLAFFYALAVEAAKLLVKAFGRTVIPATRFQTMEVFRHPKRHHLIGLRRDRHGFGGVSEKAR